LADTKDNALAGLAANWVFKCVFQKCFAENMICFSEKNFRSKSFWKKVCSSSTPSSFSTIKEYPFSDKSSVVISVLASATTGLTR